MEPGEHAQLRAQLVLYRFLNTVGEAGAAMSMTGAQLLLLALWALGGKAQSCRRHIRVQGSSGQPSQGSCFQPGLWKQSLHGAQATQRYQVQTFEPPVA